MYILKTSAAFDSAHFLHGYQGKCANLHGHRWNIEVEAGAEELQTEGEKRGMVLDFFDLKSAVRALAEEYDHALIYEENTLQSTTVSALQTEGFRLIAVPYRPTAENFAKSFYETLSRKGLPVVRVTVYETPNNCACYEDRK
ncbi:MAG: 6-carboxytetrahydropterin synthase QueD [Oscillospiraceae bacterium]|nr:6-carboxytetrahydropterin synthase QueD [Oscillospiraceae bacterium]